MIKRLSRGTGKAVRRGYYVVIRNMAKANRQSFSFFYEKPSKMLSALRASGTNSKSDDDDSLESPKDSFRRSWHEAMTGQTLPISQLWDDIDDE